MLDYAKEILTKVSFSRTLFEKELFKAAKALARDELVQLRDWCYTNFSDVYLEELERFFNNF